MNTTKRIILFSGWAWLIIFGLVPLMMMLALSFENVKTNSFTLQNYLNLLQLDYLKLFLRSINLAGFVTLITLLVGYPFAYIIAHQSEKLKKLLMMLIIIPFWTSSLIRTYAIIALLKVHGLLNKTLLALGLIHQPLHILYSNTAVVIGLVYNLLPFMILPLITNIERMDHALIEAARDLGANWRTTFFRVILPQTKTGIISGCIMVILPAMTLFYIPTILGGARSMLLGNFIQDQFLFADNWQQGAATSVLLTALVMLLAGIYWFNANKEERRSLL